MKKIQQSSALLFCLATIALTGCHVNFGVPIIQGNGVSTTQTREVKDFESVEVGGAFEVDITVGGDFACDVTLNENLISLVETKVTNNKLTVRVEGGYSTELKNKIRIVVPSLKGFHGSGATNTTITGTLVADSFEAEVSGASKLNISAEPNLESSIDHLKVDASGASQFDGATLQCKKATVSASGASKIIVKASESIDASASGASTIRYRGEAKLNSSHTSGASSIQQD